MNSRTGRLRLYFWAFYRKLLLDPQRIAAAWRKTGMQIGEGTYVYRDVRFGLSGRDPIRIGANCVLTGCTILGHDASTNRALGIPPGDPPIMQGVVVEDDCFVGYGSIVLMGVRIGKGSIVGAGAVVTRDVPPGSVVVGNPARVICAVEELVEKRKRLAVTHPQYFPKRYE